MFAQKKRQGAPARAAHPGRRQGSGQSIATAILLAFGCGAGATLCLLAVAALIFERIALPLTLAGPVACVTAGVGTAAAALVLAGRIGKNRLLLGAACGVFFCLCLLLASALHGGVIWDGHSLTLMAVVLASGTVGGVISAMRGAAAPHR